ncbi:MAG TPA: hypothetical protein VJT69_01105 [Pyrinomonadaceae bacterium]|nr:hypothetical protein [Pyrinomonadaceae bacterium]
MQLVIELQGARVPILRAGLLIFLSDEEARNYEAENGWHTLSRENKRIKQVRKNRTSQIRTSQKGEPVKD